MRNISETDTSMPQSPSWWVDKFLPIIIGGLITLIFTVIGGVIFATGGTIVKGGETTSVLSATLSRMEKDYDVQGTLIRQILERQGKAVTQEDLVRMQERIDRQIAGIQGQFQTLDNRLNDFTRSNAELQRKVDMLEVGQRLMQQFIDKMSPSARRQ